MPKYSSNGINSDGSLMNVGNKLGSRPSIKLYPQYSSGSAMAALLSDDGMGIGPASTTSRKSPANSSPTTTSTSIFNTSPQPVAQKQQQRRPQQQQQPVQQQRENSPPNLAAQRQRTLFEQGRLWHACQKGTKKEVKTLIELDGLDPSMGNPEDSQRNALHYAVVRGDIGIVSLLLSKGAKPELSDAHGKTAQDLCTRGDIRELISNRCRPW